MAIKAELRRQRRLSGDENLALIASESELQDDHREIVNVFAAVDWDSRDLLDRSR